MTYTQLLEWHNEILSQLNQVGCEDNPARRSMLARLGLLKKLLLEADALVEQLTTPTSRYPKP